MLYSVFWDFYPGIFRKHMKYDPHRHDRRSIRLKGCAYSQPGPYFVTICTQDRECLFGDIVDGEMRLNNAGNVVGDVARKISGSFPHASFDEFVVMPNHFHGIITIVPGIGPASKPGAAEGEGAATKKGAVREKEGAASSAPTVGDMMRAFKSISAIRVNRVMGREDRPLWQRNYYERIIRDDDEMQKIRRYIFENPMKWADDENYLP
jgi:putative transposase